MLRIFYFFRRPILLPSWSGLTLCSHSVSLFRLVEDNNLSVKNQFLFVRGINNGARGGTRTPMPFGMRPLNARVCHSTTRAFNELKGSSYEEFLNSQERNFFIAV